MHSGTEISGCDIIIAKQSIYGLRINETVVCACMLRDSLYINKAKKAIEGAWGMPRLPKTTKDVVSCEKPWGTANEF